MRTLATLLFTLVAAASAVQAQDLPVRVGRIAHIDGRVSLYQDPDQGWEKAYVNSPITSENSVWTDDNARAEVRVSGMALRLDQLTQLDIARLHEVEMEAFVARGSVAVNVRHHDKDERLSFNTPNARVRIRSDGRYRIDYDPARNETRVTVFAGEARIGTDDGRLRLAAGRSALVFGSDPPEFVEEQARTDAFDRWTLARDDRWREGRASTYVSTYMTGYEELDTNGEWATEPDYGALWYPRGVAANWAPYRYGRWDYVRPWGWTWIDDAPWGYAPFHYGRWVYVRNRWAWTPGERTARPVYAPALVAFVGGSNFNVRVASGGPAVGWYPLSPWDRYDPWYQASPAYVNRVNVVVRNERPTHVDRRHWHEGTRERGTTVVERSAMMERRAVAPAAIQVSAEAIRQAQAVAQRPEAVLPTRNDVIARRRQQPQPAAPAPTAPAVARQGAQPAPGTPSAQAQGHAVIVRPDFARRAVATTPQPASASSAQRPATLPAQGREAEQAQERARREAQQAQERAQRDVQQRGQQPQQQQAQERAQREAQQQAERQQREAQQAQERAQREAQQRGQQQQQQAQERAQREAQQAEERAKREAQQQAERQQREAQQRGQQQQTQQQQQQQAQERAQREAQQAQERAKREAQQQAERQQREAQQRAQQPAQQQSQQRPQQPQQQQTQERASRDAQQAQERAQKEAQQAQERAKKEAQQAQERAARDKAQKEEKEKQDKEKEKEKGKQKP